MVEPEDEKKTQIQLSQEMADWLASLKVHEREPYDSVIRRIKSGEIKKW
jgi:hypothetical protein